MAFDVNPQTGSIDITPLVSYDTRTFADEFCVFRLVFARPEDALGTGSVVIQTSMTAVQAEARAACTLSWTPEKPQVESRKHQDDTDIHYQPFPELVSEELEIYADYDGHHRHHAKHDSHLSAHVSQHFPDDPYCGGRATP